MSRSFNKVKVWRCYKKRTRKCFQRFHHSSERKRNAALLKQALADIEGDINFVHNRWSIGWILDRILDDVTFEEFSKRYMPYWSEAKIIQHWKRLVYK